MKLSDELKAQLAECQRERDVLREACKEAIRVLAFIEEGWEVRNHILVAALAATKEITDK